MSQSKRYKVSSKELKQLQRIELEMLIELDRICRKHQIKYSLDGGTLLGAVRHKGFIPWDDDIDVIMRREEYSKFKRACEKELDRGRFFLQDYRTDPHYRWGYEKLRREHTILMREGQEHLKQHTGVYIDLFVVDNVPDTFLKRYIHSMVCLMMRKVMYAEVGRVTAPSASLRKWYSILSKIPINWVFHVRNTLAKRCNKKRTNLISHYTFPYPERCKYGLPSHCFDAFVELEFEGYRFLAFKEYDEYLTKLYGTYMKLPPVEERISHLHMTNLKLVEPKL